MIKFDPDKFEAIDTVKSLRQWVKHLSASKSFCIDSETTGLDQFSDKLVGVALAFEDRSGTIQSGYVPVAHHKGKNMPVGTVLRELAEVCADPRIAKVFSNALYDLMIFSQQDQALKIRNIHDTVYMSYALSGATRYSHGMDALARDYLRFEPITFDQVVTSRPGRADFRDVPIDEAVKYSAEDTAVTLAIAKLLQMQLKKENLWEVYTRDRQIIPALLQMRLAGARVDLRELSILAETWRAECAKHQFAGDKIAGKSVKFGSPKQCMAYLTERGIPIPLNFKTKKPSLDKYSIEQLEDYEDEWIDTLLAWREPNTLLSTFADGLPKKVHPVTGRVHTNFNMCRTKTGRAASSDPNLQNIPTRTKEGQQIRNAFIADKGNLLGCADYSQIELRVLAHVADIPQLRQAFHDGLDIHARTASEMFNVPVEGMPKDVRQRAKAINFGIVYGISEFGLARQLKIGTQEAADYIELYFDRFPGIRGYMEEYRDFARSNGYVETIFGRRVYTEEINSNNGRLRGRAERLASNAPIQGSAADILRRAMPRVVEKLDANPKWKGRLLLQVHDELIVEMKDKYAEPVCRMMEHEMIHAVDDLVTWRVPIEVDAKAGSTWKKAKGEG